MENEEIYLLTIYDKGELDTIVDNTLRVKSSEILELRSKTSFSKQHHSTSH